MCEQFKNKINFEVDITYTINNKKSLQIIEMVLSGKMVEPDKTAPKPETQSKGKVKNKKNR